MRLLASENEKKNAYSRFVAKEQHSNRSKNEETTSSVFLYNGLKRRFSAKKLRLTYNICLTCFQAWCRPHLVTHFGFFELSTFPWSLSKSPIKYILPLRFQVLLYTYKPLLSVKPGNTEVIVCIGPFWS